MPSSSAPSSLSKKKVLVLGATGGTGKYVVSFLLEKGHSVVAVARSEEKLTALLSKIQPEPKDYSQNLVMKELSISDLNPSEMQELAEGCDSVVSCLGHTMTLQGMYQDGYFVSSVTKLVCQCMPKGCRLIVMGSEGVAKPDGSDPVRPLSERFILFLLRWLVPPHADNELVAQYLYKHQDTVDWTVVRPTDLIDGTVTEYDIFDTSEGSLFGSGVATRANVADFMVRLVLEEQATWNNTYRHAMPVLKDKVLPVAESSKVDCTEKKDR
ncbi:NADPH-binding protein [Nitzschia inconspicua]|uniref:NADPH-binding protein n=1 Tax=Nitzschia inconspicua TaxID=303405 RepID=A0A9K3K524_9STRA|nr:NADPH-binding protein [Nitzschia inconspicua]KAG7337044.1 NADPH-binding protein [Nitzschia inconspicua]KAG7344668.1 NADPH-binding protein [Nitzschia inconspicua]